MRIGPRYKRARRLGADIFPKTDSPKYAIRAGKALVKGYGRSEFGAQLKEKQRARFFYGISERQFSRYVKNAIAKKSERDDEALYTELETRLDNVIYRFGIAPSRQAARQYVSHGHFTVAEALRKVKGIGHNLASNLAIPVTTKLNVSLSELIGNLSEEQTTELEGIVKFPQKFGVKNFMLNRQQDIDSGEAKHLLMAELAFAKRQDITRERDSRSYRGWRHSIGQKTRGQHTRTTGRTGMTVGVLKKAVKAAKAAAATGAQEKSGGEKEKK